MRLLKVNLDKKSSSSYEIHIGTSILDRMALLIAKNHKAGRHVVITDSNVGRLHGDKLITVMQGVGLHADLIEFPAGEASKNINTVLAVVKKLLDLGADRKSLLVAFGGGVVGDMVGFIASVFMRAVPYIQIPTTLIAQVDSSVGGKTAVDLPYGKNLLGTFYQPRAVFADLSYLATLPEKEFINGLAEIIKYGVIDDEKILRLLEDNIDSLKKRDMLLLLRIVESCCRIKKSIVEIDEKEQGLRQILNYGHTLGHALEAQSDFAVTHGEGVALGMIAAARISEKTGYLESAARERIEYLIQKAGLPCRLPGGLPVAKVIARLKMDKKKEGDVVHFILLKKIGMPFVNGGIDDAVITAVMEEMQ
ncbi:MAG TPA: 3-dehydroquinate synthase [Smithellaceae bacterium]|nr:3-dehydroquinate synthase [Smithellaceae bacterium]